MSNAVNAYRTLDKEEAELEKRLHEIRQKKEAQARELRSAQVGILGEAVLKGLETGVIEKSFLETLNLSKKERKFFDDLELPTTAPKPKGWDKVE